MQLEMRRLGSGFRFWHEGLDIELKLRRVHSKSDGIHGYLEVYYRTSGRYLENANINLSSLQTRHSWAKKLDEKCPIVTDNQGWDSILGLVALSVEEDLDKGSPPVTISSTVPFEPIKYILGPIIPYEEPTIIYAGGGVGKSLISLLMGICIQFPWDDNPFGFVTLDDPINVLYLDWESHEKVAETRLRGIINGMGKTIGREMAPCELQYRLCTRALADDIEEIQQICMQYTIGFVIIDSLLPASGTGAWEPDSPRNFFMALRQLRVSSLIVAHEAKNNMGEEKNLYGSVFFWNLARQIWTLKRNQEPGEREIHLALHHVKSNIDELHRPIGFSVDFAYDSIQFSPMNVTDDTHLAQGVPDAQRIQEYLRRYGQDDAKAIASELQLSEKRVLSALQQHHNKFACDPAGKWALLARPEHIGAGCG